MGNYNPRQNTRMRWKDARELEKFSFFYGSFDIRAEQLENVSQDVDWSKIANLFNNYDNKGVILYDTAQEFLFTGYLSGEYLYLYSANETGVTHAEITYDKKTDRMQINFTSETFLAEDNIKTLFGQDIVGTGAINLYRHDLTFTEGNGDKYVGVVYSSKNLKVNTFDKLATLIGRTGNQNISVVKTTAIDETDKDATNIRVYWYTEGFVWLAANNTGTIKVALGEVSDVVTPI